MSSSDASGSIPDYSGWEAITEQPFYRRQIPFIAEWAQGRVLDIASNYGRFSVLSASTVSLDIDRRWLQRGVVLGNIRRAVEASAYSLPFNRECFDTVLAIGVVEHIPPRFMSRFLDEVTRVSKRGGHLVIQTASPFAPFSLSRVRLWSDYLHPYSPFRLRRELRGRGWRHLAWISSGLVGVTPILPYSVGALVPWAVGVAQVHVRAP